MPFFWPLLIPAHELLKFVSIGTGRGGQLFGALSRQLTISLWRLSQFLPGIGAHYGPSSDDNTHPVSR